ncbi:enoyl-CoA hydratase/isomerase family protein [Amycolatopsis jejuensis]|uniref:enoyl-CoA hydratase/isomerase family protein n=1 Tax=Amycolatopsis jejuensis TaxID=330084 RepID=UPI00068FEDA3|nr:enoyl-CoA hydratase/isomerase family protein [Amycolatopsis jejuensis]
MSYRFLRYEQVAPGVVSVVLDRPRSLNALNRGLQLELVAAIETAEADPDVRALVLSGAPGPDGRSHFSSGADHKELAGTSDTPPTRDELARGFAGIPRSALPTEPPLLEACTLLENADLVSIAVIDGVCTAGGLELALACDLRIAADTCRISDLHLANLGNIGGAGVSVRLARTVGPAWTLQLMLSGEPIDADTAMRIGLVNEVHPASELVAAGVRLAELAARHPAAVVAVLKGAVAAAAELPSAVAVRYSLLGRALLRRQGAYGDVGRGKP